MSPWSHHRLRHWKRNMQHSRFHWLTRLKLCSACGFWTPAQQRMLVGLYGSPVVEAGWSGRSRNANICTTSAEMEASRSLSAGSSRMLGHHCQIKRYPFFHSHAPNFVPALFLWLIIRVTSLQLGLAQQLDRPQDLVVSVLVFWVLILIVIRIAFHFSYRRILPLPHASRMARTLMTTCTFREEDRNP